MRPSPQTCIGYQGRLDELKTHHDADWAESERRFTALVDSATALKAELDQALVESEGRAVLCKQLAAELAEAKGNRDYIQTQLDEIQPQLALIYSQREELTKLCDKVRERMNARERREEQAILNRKAIAKVAPEPNRR